MSRLVPLTTSLLLLAALPAPEPGAVVKDTLERIQAAVVGEGTRREKLASVSDVARALLDTDRMARDALGPEFDRQPPERQQEFRELFDDMIVRRYLRKLLLFRDPDFAFVGQDVEGDQAVIHTRILTRLDEYSIDYPMHRDGGRWQATDIVIEGVSMTANYRDQFDTLLRSYSFEELLDLMRRKIRQLEDARG